MCKVGATKLSGYHRSNHYSPSRTSQYHHWNMYIFQSLNVAGDTFKIRDLLTLLYLRLSGIWVPSFNPNLTEWST